VTVTTRSAAAAPAARLDDVPPGLHSIADNALNFLRSRVEKVLSLASDELLENTRSAETPEERRAYFDVAQQLALHRDDCIAAFVEEFLLGFMPAPRNRAHLGAGFDNLAPVNDLEVLNGDAFDLSVAVSTTTSRSASSYKAYLEQLTGAISNIRGGTGLTARGNPLGVFRITGSFMTAIGRLRLEVGVQRLLLDLFEREVITPLGELYAASCRLLDLEVPDEARAAERVVNPAGADWAGRDGATAPGFLELQGLLRSALSPRGGFGRYDENAAPPSVSPVQLSDALSAAGAGIPPIDSGKALDLLELAAAILAHSGGTLDQVEPAALDILQLVSLLFEHILNNEALSIPIAAQICRLQIPVLKAALADSTLFDTPSHAARQVINRLAAVGIGWSADSEQVRRDPLYGQIERIVGRVVDECHADPAVFETASEELAKVAFEYARRTSALEQRLNQREAGRAQVVAAKAVVQAFVNGRVAGAKVPAGIGRFIREGWTQVLVYLCVRHGVNSELWAEAQDALDDLLLLGQPVATEPELQHRGDRVAGLLTAFRQWFETAGIGSTRVEAFIAMLHEAFQDLDQHDQAWLGLQSGYEVQEFDEVEVIELVPATHQPATAVDTELEPLLASLVPGTWVEILQGERPAFRCKLSIILEQTRNYLFVDHRGVRVDEIPARHVAEQLRDGRMRELKDDPVVERALDDLIAELRAEMTA
jgi:hypothetical protein